MIIHMDMDAFYASVEQLDNPKLRGRPVIVGGRSKRSVVTTASYEARKFGIRSAMPMFQARNLCPGAVIVPGRMKRYKEVSKAMMGALTEFSPLVETVSIDEAFIDISGCEKIHGSPWDIGRKIKHKIKEVTKLSCSVGGAPLKFLAKVASDLKKPDGLVIISNDDVMEFIQGLSLEKVPGVGKVVGNKLKKMNLHTLGDIKAYPEKTLVRGLGKFGLRLIQLAHGVDDSTVDPYRPVKSVSAEATLSHDTRDLEILGKFLLAHSERIGRELRSSGIKAKTLGIKIKYEDFKQTTRSLTLTGPTSSSRVIYKEALKLLESKKPFTPVRLIGLSASGLVAEDLPVQGELFRGNNDFQRKWNNVDRAVDLINKKFGGKMIDKAAFKE